MTSPKPVIKKTRAVSRSHYGIARRAAAFATTVAGPICVFCFFIGGWTLLSITVYAKEHYLLPTPWGVALGAIQNAALLGFAAKLTLIESVVGFVSAIVLGVLLASIMSQAKWLERSLYPYAVFLQTVPVVAVAPIIVLWVGYNQKAVIVISFIISLFPIINNSLLGLLSTDRNQIDLFRMHKADRFSIFFKLRLPAAMPNIIAGLRISSGLSVIGAIVGEFIIGSGGSRGGLGVQVIFSQSKLQTNLLFAEVFAATLLGFAFFLVVSWFGFLVLHNWHESVVRTDR